MTGISGRRVRLVTVAAGLLAIDLLVPHLTSLVGVKLIPAFLVAGIGGGLVITPNVTMTLAEVDPKRAGSGGGMLQTAQRVGSGIGVAVVLAQFFGALASSHGNYARALSVSLRTTLLLILVALAFALADLVRRTSSQQVAPRRAVGMPRRGGAQPAPRRAA